MTFASAYNRHKSIPAPEETYSPYEATYHEEIIDGFTQLVEDGVRNVYEAIQMHADDGDINIILDRITRGYDYDLLPEGTYGDFSEAPHTLAEAQSVILAVKDEFNRLSPEVRAKFGNSETNYVDMYGTTDWARNLGMLNEEVVKEVAPVEQKQ